MGYWGFNLKDRVEARRNGRWERGSISGFYMRSPIVTFTDGSSQTYHNVKMVRPWKPPTTPEEIEAFLSGQVSDD